MSALLRGLNEGLQTGLRLGGTLRDVRQRRALADESARFNVTEGAYGEDLQQNIQQLEGLKAQDPAQAPAYDQAIQELQRRSQMTAPDFSIASGPQAFGTREEATRAARPMRAEGLASVYERFGDIDQAEAARERADAGRMREVQFRSAQLGLEGQERQAESDRRVASFNEFRAANPDLTIPELKAAARTEFKLNDDELLRVTANIAGLQENELKIWKNEVVDLIKGKSLDEIVKIKNEDDRFDPTQDIKVERRGGRTFVSEVDKTTGRTLSTQSFESDNAAREFLRKRAVEPETLADWLLQRKKIESGIQLQGAQAARAGRSSMQEWAENFTELMGREPTQEEIRVRMGVEGRPSAARVPTAADINSRARMYLDNDRTNTLTVQEATALAERDFGLREGPTNQRASLVDQAISGPAATAPRATATPAGQQLLGLYNTLVPPEQRPAIPRPGPTTSQERLQQFYR